MKLNFATKTWLRPRSWRFYILIVGSVLLAPLFLPSGALAQFGGFDPAGQVASMSSSNNWLGHAQEWARTIYFTLIAFEIIALGITTLLFRENLGEFFASVGFKIMMGSLFFWFIANAGVGGLPGQVRDTFTYFGQQVSGGSGDPTVLMAEGLTAATGYFEAGAIAKKADLTNATTQEPLVPPGNCIQYFAEGFCYRAYSEGLLHTHDFFELVVNALAVMIAMAMAAIYLQFALITIETYLVMGVGTLFIGFAGSRFTMPFSQGYFSYMINVGVKLMSLYIVLGLIGPLLKNILLSSALTIALTAGTDILGVSYPAALAAAAYGALSCVIAAALVNLVPGFASSFLTGQSTVSGNAALQQTMSSVAGSTQMMAQLASASHHSKSAESSRSSEQHMANAHSAGGNAAASAANMAPASASQAFAPQTSAAGAGSAATPGLDRGGGAMNDLMNMQNPNVNVSVPGGGSGPAMPASAAVSAQAMPPAETRSSAGALTGNGNGSSMPPVSRGGNDRRQDSNQPAFAPVSSGSGGGGGGTYVPGPGGANLDTESGGGSGSGSPGLNSFSVSQLQNMSADQARLAAANTDFSTLLEDKKAAVMSDPGRAKAVESFLNERSAEETRNADLAMGFGMSGLASASGRDVGQPTAVQVRMSNPDKL